MIALRRAALGAVICALGFAGIGRGATPRASAGRPALAVTGFQSEGDPPARIDASAAALTTVGVDGVNLVAGGARVPTPDASALRQLRRAHADHLRAELLVGNFSEAINDFSEPLAHGLLGSPARIRAVSGRLAAIVRRERWDGISLDLESLQPRDAVGLVTLVRALRAALPAEATVSVNVSNNVSAGGFRAGGYDLPALGRAASRLILMAYDEHGPWERTPGPVGALRWQRAGLATMLATVPAGRVDLGVAGYGYAWLPHRRVQLSDAGARALVARSRARARWVAAVGEWTARLPGGGTVWWSDARSLALRAGLAASLHLHGVAVWSLGLSDPLTRAAAADRAG